MPRKPQTQSHAPETTINAADTPSESSEWQFSRWWVKDTPDETRIHFAECRLHGHSCWKVIESVRKLCLEADSYTPYAPYTPYEIHRFSALGCIYTTHNIRIDNGERVLNATIKMRGDFANDAVIRALEKQGYLVAGVDSKITNWKIVDNANRDTEITRIFLGLLGSDTPPFPSLKAAFEALVNLQSLDQISRTEYTEEAQWRAEIEEFFTVFAQTRSEYSKWLDEAAPVPTEIIDVPASDCQFKISQAAAAPINATANKTKRKTEDQQASSSVRRNELIFAEYKRGGYERYGLTTATLDDLLNWWEALSATRKENEGVLDKLSYKTRADNWRAKARRAIKLAIERRLKQENW